MYTDYQVKIKNMPQLELQKLEKIWFKPENNTGFCFCKLDILGDKSGFLSINLVEDSVF